MTGPDPGSPAGSTWTEYAIVTRYGLVCPITGPDAARPYVLNRCTLVERLVTAIPQPDGGYALISVGWWHDTKETPAA